MPSIYYNDFRIPEVAVNEKTGEVEHVTHTHDKEINYYNYGIRDRSQLKTNIDKQITRVKGCQAFFKTLAAKAEGANVKALAEGAAAEDEERIKELEKHRPSSCSIL